MESAASGRAADRSEDGGGYGLLADVLAKQSNVDKLLWFKSEREAVGDRVRAIAEDCRSFLETVRGWSEESGGPSLAMPALPDAETSARSWIEDRTAGQLLNSGGEAFETRLLLSQAEAAAYLAALSDGLARRSDESGRRSELEAFRDRMLEHREAVLGMLSVRRSG